MDRSEEFPGSGALFRAFFDQAAVGMAQVDLLGRRLRFNRKLCDMVGYSPEEMAGLTFEDITHPDDLEEDQVRIRGLLEGRERSFILEKRFLHKDGRHVWVNFTMSLERDAQTGRPLWFVAIIQEVTALKVSREKARLAEDQLRQVQKLEALGRLAGGIAHDFNNLLTAINGYGDLLLAAIPPDEQERDFVQEIRKAGDRAASLTRQLLAFSRKQVLAPKAMDLGAVVSDMGGLLKRLLGDDITLDIRQAPDLEPVLADRGQMEQVILNLALNARDAMPSGGGLRLETAMVPTMEGGKRRAELPVSLSVSDTGKGMDESTRAHIFDPFFTTKAPGKGTGLGLSLVYGIVTQSGGHIEVSSEPGKGSTFRVLLPAAPEARKAAAPSPAVDCENAPPRPIALIP